MIDEHLNFLNLISKSLKMRISLLGINNNQMHGMSGHHCIISYCMQKIYK